MERESSLSRSLEKGAWSDVAFVSTILKDPSIVSSVLEPWTQGGGMACDSNVLVLTHSDGSRTRYFFKMTQSEKRAQMASLGTAREGLFYQSCASDPLLSSITPQVLFSHGDMKEGAKVVIMELIDGVQAGYFFGESSLHNWGKDLSALTRDYAALTEGELVLECFRSAAKLHAGHWNKIESFRPQESAFDGSLRALSWAKGEDRGSWEASHHFALSGWDEVRNATLSAEADGSFDKDIHVKLDARFVTTLDSAFQGTSWETLQQKWVPLPKTMVHGDFHPSNVVVRRPTSCSQRCQVILVDWEAVGVGSGPQDLGQFLISHSSPANRRTEEQTALLAYQQELACLGVNVTTEYVLREYIDGGIGRWFWLFGVCGGLKVPLPALQFFHDQMLAFLVDHQVDSSNPPIVRS